MVLRGGGRGEVALGGDYVMEGGVLMSGISALLKRAPATPSSLPCEDPAKKAVF